MILLRNIILLRKNQLVTSYTLKLDVNRCFWTKCKHVYKPVVSFIKKRICQYDWLIDFWCLTPLSAIFQLYHGDDLSVCKYDWSYYYWSLYCNLTIVMIRKYLKSDKYLSIVWIFAKAANFSYFVQYKIVISMLNCYCRKPLIFLCFLWHWHHGWCSIRYTHFKSLSRCINWVVGDSFYNTIF